MSTENLSNKEGIKKLKELAEKARICLFCTNLDEQPVSTRPMSLQEVDEEGNLWFISSKESNKNFDIKADKKVQLFFSNNSDSEYLSVYGDAYIYTDQATIDEKWSAFAKPWFDEGKEDPAVTIIRVQPSESYYWDTKAGKMVSILSFAFAVIAGKETDNSDGIEGKIKI